MSVNLIINGKPVCARDNVTVLQAASEAGIHIPSLCFLKDCNQIAACRMCVVEIKGARTLMPACATKVRDGMEIVTDSPDVQNSRRHTLDLIFKHHNTKCEYCSRYSDCELHAMLRSLGMNEHGYETGERSCPDCTTKSIVRDNTKCITCRRCVSACSKVQGANVLKAFRRGGATYIGCSEESLSQSACTLCGACVQACPTGALSVYSEMEKVAFALRNKGNRKVIAVVASEASASIGAVFYDKNPAPEKLNSALRQLGFDAVVDRNELGGIIACPAVERYISHHHPSLAGYGKNALEKTFLQLRQMLAQKFSISESNLFLVSISPCTSEKGLDNGADVTLTTVETVELIRHQCVSRFTANLFWNSLQPESFDSVGIERLQPETTRVEGLRAVEEVLTQIENGTQNAEAVSLWACPGGCICGGGQPRVQRSGYGN